MIRPVLEYCCPVWHPGLTRANHDEIESVQRRVLKLIFSQLSYHDALFVAGLEKLETRRHKLSVKAFNQIKADTHILNKLLVRRELDSGLVNLRAKYPFILPRLKTDRAAKSLIWYGTKKQMVIVVVLDNSLFKLILYRVASFISFDVNCGFMIANCFFIC